MPLHMAARSNPFPAVVRLLLDRGAMLRATIEWSYESFELEFSWDRINPLHLAAGYSGEPTVVALLLDRGLGVNSRDTGNRTPLHLAAWNENPEIAALLLDQGADIGAKATHPDEDYFDGGTPLHYAAQNANPAVAKLLLDRGADIEATAAGDETPTMFATYNRGEAPVETVILLLNRSASIEGNGDWKLIHSVASHSHDAALVSVLLSRGADIESRTSSRETPLIVAVRDNNLEMVRILLDKGADVAATTDYGRTALQIAEESTWVDSAVADLLRGRGGADVPGIDADGDGFIEISTLEQLDAVRLDTRGTGQFRNFGSSSARTYVAAFPGAACSNCVGYELTRDLHFGDPRSYASGQVNQAWIINNGWEPISQYSGFFEGNGHTITGLYQYGRSAGLFRSFQGTLRHLGLISVNVTETSQVGALASRNSGPISNAYVTGTVSGIGDVGGLVGLNYGGSGKGEILESYSSAEVTGSGNVVGGLVGENNEGRISNSYGTGAVSADGQTGGLVGYNSGTIISRYATGGVTARSSSVGGLVGNNRGTATGSYAAGSVSGPSTVGGLIGSHSGNATASYWDTQASGQSTGVGSGSSSGVTGRTTAQLQALTGYTGIYPGWGAVRVSVAGTLGPAANTRY